jgi:hypothetical protein
MTSTKRDNSPQKGKVAKLNKRFGHLHETKDLQPGESVGAATVDPLKEYYKLIDLLSINDWARVTKSSNGMLPLSPSPRTLRLTAPVSASLSPTTRM